jgi:hypothetical protein
MAKSKGTSEYAPPKSDAYTGLLIISLLALIAGCTFLYLDWSQYSKTKPQLPGSASTSRPGAGQPQPGAQQGAQGGQAGAQGAMGAMGGAMGQMGGAPMGAMGGAMGQMGGGAMGQMGMGQMGNK